MKTIKLWTILALLATAATTLTAGRYCWKIQEDDLRHYCEAVAEGKKSCWKIKNADEKHYCEAVAEGKRSCWKIANSDKKNLCEALTNR